MNKDLRQEIKTKKCPGCKGTGRQENRMFGNTFHCDKCHGTGTVKPTKKRMEKIKKIETIIIFGDRLANLTDIHNAFVPYYNKINELIDAYNLDK